MQCLGLTIHKYSEAEDMTRCHPLNPTLLNFITEQGWTISTKLAEGSVSDVFTCRQNHIVAVLILFGNVDLENRDAWNIYPKIERAREFPNIFPIIYDVFTTDIPYSQDRVYLNDSTDFASRTIQVIEKLDMTLETYLHGLSPHEVLAFVPVLRKTLIRYLTILGDSAIYYTDLKLDNIGVIVTSIVYLKLIDIEGIQLRTVNHFDVQELVDSIIKYDILLPLNL